MWHPVRLAVQTALLDNLSHGRLMVGIGPGTSVNEYEYRGFGSPMDERRAMMQEAEELLVKAWTQENVRHEGKYWQTIFPRLRPVPYQKPHPFLLHACSSDGSLVAMAKLGRPIMLTLVKTEDDLQRLKLYRATMLQAGFEENRAEKAMDEIWNTRFLFVADTDAEAYELAGGPGGLSGRGREQI